MVRAFRCTDATTPVVLMGYANPIERYGIERFVADAAAAGVDGVLVVDYPPEECEEFARLLKDHDIDPIFLLAPTSTEQRIRDVGRIATGYVYYVSLKGVTGAGHLDTARRDECGAADPRARESCRSASASAFATPPRRARSPTVADAVVIGNGAGAIARRRDARQCRRQRLRGFIAGIRTALDT